LRRMRCTDIGGKLQTRRDQPFALCLAPAPDIGLGDRVARRRTPLAAKLVHEAGWRRVGAAAASLVLFVGHRTPPAPKLTVMAEEVHPECDVFAANTSHTSEVASSASP